MQPKTYRGFNLDVYQNQQTGLWVCEFWSRTNCQVDGEQEGDSEREVVDLAILAIDGWHKTKGEKNGNGSEAVESE